MNAIIRFFAQKGLFGDILTLFIIVAGAVSALLIKREAFPNIDFDIVSINTPFPGASAEETERLVTNPIEINLKQVDGIKKINSVSLEGASIIFMELDPDQADVRKIESDIESAVDQWTDRPEGVEDPVVTSLSTKTSPVIEVTVASTGDEVARRAQAKRIKKELERIPGVARIAERGFRELEIQVLADPNRMRQTGVSLENIIQTIKALNVNIAGGSLQGGQGQQERIVRTLGQVENADQIANAVIRSNDLGRDLRVSDVAQVSNTLAEAKDLNRTNGKDSLSLVVLKKESADIIDVVQKVKERVESLRATLPDGFQLGYINDVSYYVERRLKILSGNLLVGLLLVLLVLGLILPLKVAMLVSIGIPFAFFGTIAMFYYIGVSINLLTMLGLIIVSGMLVDDAIVVVDNVVRHMEDGVEPKKSAIDGTIEVWPAVTVSVVTTLAVFIPMLFMTGIFGKFVKFIPYAVIIALVLSLVEAFLIFPQHLARWIRVKPREQRLQEKSWLHATQNFWDNSIVPRYIRLIQSILKLRYLTAFGLFLFFVGTLWFAKARLHFILFPSDGIEIFFIRSKAPIGVSLDEMAHHMKQLEAVVSDLPKSEVKDYVTNVGVHQQDDIDPEKKRGSEYAQIVLYLTPAQTRQRTADDIIDELRDKIGTPPHFEKIAFARVNPGPPVGKAISVGVRGDLYEDILPAVEALKTMIQSVPGAKDVEDSFTPGKEEIRLIPKQSELAATGLSTAQLGLTVRAAFEGIVASTIKTLDEEIKIRVQLPVDDRRSVESLRRLAISNPRGTLIPVSSLASIETARGVRSFEHEASQRQVRVIGEVDPALTTSQTVNEEIKKRIPELQKQYPQLQFVFGGEDQDTQESLASLARAFVVAILLVFLTMVLLFQNLVQPFLVMLAPPLGIISVIWILAIHGMPLSFMAFLGILALTGVIVNNAIVFIDFVNQGRAKGTTPQESILNAAQMRLRPMFLTTLTTVFGLLPTAYGIGGLDEFVVPVVMALGWGLFLGSILTAFAMPIFISISDDLRGLNKKSQTGALS